LSAHTPSSLKEKHDLYRIEQGIHFSASTGGIYETTKKEVEPDALFANYANTGYPFAKWGNDNNYAQRLIDAVMADPSATLLEKRRAMHWGRGLMFYNKEIDEKGNEKIKIVDDKNVPQEIKDFFWLNDFPNFIQGCIADFEWWHAFCVQYITNPAGKILQVKWQRMKDVRPERRNPETGNIDNYYLSALWPLPPNNAWAKIPAFDRLGNGSGLYKHQLVSIDKDYFPQPGWHGITRWLYIAQKIPRWILANIDNSINLKYHVKIPLEYFLKRHPVEAYKTGEERNLAIQADEELVKKNIDDFLAGEKNVHKAFYSKVALGDDGKPLPGWEIITIPNEIKDEAWLNAYGVATMANTSGMGLSPSLGGQILPNGLGSGSGSDLREQFNFFMQVMTAQPRQTTLEPWEVIKRRNGWPEELHLGYRDVVLQSIDQNKSGQATQNEQSPTSPNQDNNKSQP
jgi:hypothetical protein